MEIKKVMHKHPYIIAPNSTLAQAAQYMQEFECGILPVGDEKKIIGMITDRDIVVRALALGKNPNTTQVRQIMSKQVFSCFDDDSLEDATDTMRKKNVSRLLVINHKNKVLGIVSFAQLLRNTGNLKESDHVVHHLLKQSSRGKSAEYKNWQKSKKHA